MLRTVDRYLLRAFLWNYALSLFVMISLYVTLDLFLNFDEFTENGYPIGHVLLNVIDFYGYNIPLYFAQLSGPITLFAAAMTLARMHRANEMTAMLASGMSMYRIAAPVLAAGLLMNVLWVADQEALIPRIAPKLSRFRDDVEGRRVYRAWCLRDGENRLLSAAKFVPGQSLLGNLNVIERTPDGQFAGVIVADTAEWEAAERRWKLTRGLELRPGTESGDGFRPDAKLERRAVEYYETDLTPDELMLRQSKQWLGFLGLSQLADLERRGIVGEEQVARIRHQRFTQPFLNMILLVLGIVFFLNREPRSVVVLGGKALALSALVFITGYVGQQLVGAITVAPALPAWVPILLFTPVAALMLDGVKT